MAISDLAPQQLESLTQALYAPPPPSLAAPQEEYPLAMLSSSQKFIDQLERMQKAREEAALQTQAASALSQISPLDPEYDSKVRQVAMQFGPSTFASSPVQHLLSLSDRQRNQMASMQEKQQKAAREATLDASFQFLRTANEDDLDQFVQQYPDMARELGPMLDKRFVDLTNARTQLSQLPEHLRSEVVDSREVPIPAKVTSKLREFNESFEGPLGKVASLERKRKLVKLAEQWNALPKEDTSKEAADARTQLVDDMTAELGKDETISESIIRGILLDAPKLTAPRDPKVASDHAAYMEKLRAEVEAMGKAKAAKQ